MENKPLAAIALAGRASSEARPDQPIARAREAGPVDPGRPQPVRKRESVRGVGERREGLAPVRRERLAPCFCHSLGRQILGVLLPVGERAQRPPHASRCAGRSASRGSPPRKSNSLPSVPVLGSRSQGSESGLMCVRTLGVSPQGPARRPTRTGPQRRPRHSTPDCQFTIGPTHHTPAQAKTPCHAACCLDCRRRVTRVYVPTLDTPARCRKCWGLLYESRKASYRRSEPFACLGSCGEADSSPPARGLAYDSAHHAV